MRLRTALVISIVLAFSPALAAQRRGGGGGGGGGRPSGGPPPSMGRPNPSPGGGMMRAGAQRNLPSTPVGPMTNPIAPVVPYGGAGRGLGIPQGPRPGAPLGRFTDRGRGDVVLAPYWSPYYGPYLWDYTYFDPYLRPPTTPGQLPGVWTPPPEPTAYAPEPATVAEPEPPAPVTFFYPETNIIVDLPEPGRPAPAIGTTRAEVLAQYGQPWGSIIVRGQETLYLRGGLKVLMVDDRVFQVR